MGSSAAVQTYVNDEKTRYIIKKIFVFGLLNAETKYNCDNFYLSLF